MANLYYGRGKDKDNGKLIDFLDEVFFTKEGDNTNFLELLPKIYKDKYRPAYNNFVVQDETGCFRSAIGNFYNDIIVGGELIKACCIGNVAVGKEYRSMGYMKELMTMSVEDMKQNGTDISYLSGQRQRYGYFGYETAGTCFNFYFNRQTVKHALGNAAGGLLLEKLREDDYETIKKISEIFENRPIASVRPVENYFDILSSWNSVPYVLLENGEFVGYLVFFDNKSRILEFNVIDPSYIKRAVLCAFENTEENCLIFPICPYDAEKINFFTDKSELMKIENNESVLIFNFEKVIRAYFKAKASCQKLCNGEMTVLIHGVNGDEALHIAVTNGNVLVEKFNGQAEYELTHHEATRAFFSNYSADRNVFPPEIQQWLPLYSYLPGPDTM